MRTPRPFLGPFPNGLAWALVGCVWMACLNPQPDELPTDAPRNPGASDNVPGDSTGSAGSSAFSGGGQDNAGGGAAGSGPSGVEAPAPDAGAPLEMVGADAGPGPDAGPAPDAGPGRRPADAGAADGGLP